MLLLSNVERDMRLVTLLQAKNRFSCVVLHIMEKSFQVGIKLLKDYKKVCMTFGYIWIRIYISKLTKGFQFYMSSHLYFGKVTKSFTLFF